MPVNLSPLAGAAAQFLDNSGNVLTGGKLYTYLAGTTTPAVTYTSNTGVTFHPNPIILNAAGRVPSGEIWLTEGISYKFVLKDANEVLLGTYDNIVGINDFSSLQNIVANFTGTGLQVSFDLLAFPANENSTQIYINGVYQQKNTYSITGTVITFSQAPPFTSTIEVNYV